jgi:hypothetical protein
VTSRAAVLAAGLWLGFLVASWIVAGATFRAAERVAGSGARPEVAARLGPVPTEDRRLVLRHLASEINRSMFRTWSGVQLGLGLLLAGLAWRAGGAARALAIGALVLTVVQAAGLAGAIESLGRQIDFLPRPLPAETGRRFGLLHGAYVLLDLVKAAALGGVAAALLRSRG